MLVCNIDRFRLDSEPIDRSECIFPVLCGDCGLFGGGRNCGHNIMVDRKSISTRKPPGRRHWMGLLIRCSFECILSAINSAALCSVVLLSWFVWIVAVLVQVSANILWILSAIINKDWFFSRVFGNTIWLLALSYYIYITFLGYNCKWVTMGTIYANGNFTNMEHFTLVQVFHFWRTHESFWLQSH